MKKEVSGFYLLVLFVFLLLQSPCFAHKKLGADEIETLRFLGSNHVPLKIMTAYQSGLNHSFVVDLIKTVNAINLNGSLPEKCKVLIIPTSYDLGKKFADLRGQVGEKLWKSTVEVAEKTLHGSDIWLQDWGEIAAVRTKSQTEEKLAIFDSIRHGSAGMLPVDLARLWNGYYIENPSREYSGGDNGGNIEVTPDGLLLTGNSSTPELRAFLEEKGYKDNLLVMETDWLRVGHVDEYVSIVPNPKAADGYTIIKANPRLGLQLMAKAAKAELEVLAAQNRKSAMHGTYEVDLAALAEFLKKKRSSASSVANAVNLSVADSRALAEVDADTNFSLDLSDEDIAVADNHRLAAFAKANLALATLIDDNVRRLRERINRGKGRDLNTPVSIISYPMLFHKTPQTGKQYISMLPGVVNQVSLGQNLIVPDPQISSFRKHIEKIGTMVGLNMFFIDASVYHLRWGDIHCGTNVFRHPSKVFSTVNRR